MAAGQQFGETRVAIVIGNGAYSHGLPPLPNPPHDAAAVARALTGLGFEVFLITDASGEGLRACLQRAYGQMSHAAVGLLYYSGHGIQIDDENYFVATDAREDDAKTGFVAVQPVVDEIQRRAAATLVFLDACRNNPLAHEGREGLSVSTGRAIQVVSNAAPAPGAVSPQIHGLMVAYSTSPNAVALDGDGELSPFTDAFVHEIGTPGYSIQRVMGEVTKAVGEQTAWAQTPWMKSSLTSELKLDGAQTLEEAQAISQNWATTSVKLLWTHQGRNPALVAALKGLPADADDATLKLFPQAYLAVYSAMQTNMTTLPIAGWTSGDISRHDVVALLHRLATGGSRLELWSRTRQTLLRILADYPQDQFHSVKFSPDGSMLVSFGEDKVAGWDVASGSKLFETVVAHDPVGGLFGDKRMIFAVGYSPDGRFLYATASDKNLVQILDARTGRLVQALQSSDFPAELGIVNAPMAGFTDKDDLVLMLGSKLQESTTIVGTYDLAARRFHLVDRESNRSGMYFGFDPRGRYLCLTLLPRGGQPDFVVWDMRSGQKLMTATGMVMNASFDPNAPFVVTSQGTVTKVYDLSTGAETHLPTIPDGFRSMPSGVFSTDGIPSPLAMSAGPWFSWDLPDGRMLVDRAMSMLTPEEQGDIARERISFMAAD